MAVEVVVVHSFSDLALQLGVILLYVWASAIMFGDCGHCHLGRHQVTQIVNDHNRFRAEVVPPACPPLPPMEWNSVLAKVAQSYADKCIYNHNAQRTADTMGTFSYIGENLFIATGNNTDVSQAVSSWNSEKQYYTLRTNTCSPGKVCGHYTQVVWSTSVHVGCGVATCNARNMPTSPWPAYRFPQVYIVVCNYGPGGNYRGKKPYNEYECTATTSRKPRMMGRRIM